MYSTWSTPSERAPGPPKRTLYVLTALVGGAYALWTVRSGIRVGTDTATYSRWADLLIAHDFNISSYLSEQSFVVPPVLYLSWIVVVAALKIILGASWTTGVVVLNWAALVTGVYRTLALVRRLACSRAAVVLSALLFLAAGDLLLFVPFVLSDLMFWVISTAVLTCGIALATEDERPVTEDAGLLIAGSGLTAVALVFRPTGAPLATFWMAAVVVRLSRRVVIRALVPLLISIVALAGVAIVVHAYILTHPGIWPSGQLPGILAMLADEYRAGVLVYGLPAMAPAVDWPGTIGLTFLKLAYFFTPWLPHYSVAHVVINAVFFAPVYALSAAAVVNMRRLARAQQLAVALLSTYIVILSSFHAMMQIDYDHRYRLPLLPALIVLAAIGLESLRRLPMVAGITARWAPPRTLATSDPQSRRSNSD
jgi:hypothetical protein